MTKRALIAQIHIAKKDLGLDDDTYRHALKAATGKTSAGDMTVPELHKAIAAFKERGFKVRPGKKTGPKSRAYTKTKHGTEIGGPTQGDKIRALWLSMADDGIVRDRSEEALRNYIRKQTKGEYSAPQFCDADTASNIIERMKRWHRRALQERKQCN